MLFFYEYNSISNNLYCKEIAYLSWQTFNYWMHHQNVKYIYDVKRNNVLFISQYTRYDTSDTDPYLHRSHVLQVNVCCLHMCICNRVIATRNCNSY